MPDATELKRASADIPLTHAAREILERATSIAAEHGEAETSAADVLEATIADKGSLAARQLRDLGVDMSSIDARSTPDGAVSLRQLVVNANREAQVLGHYRVDSIHLLLALLYADSPATSEPLQKAGLTLYALRSQLQGMSGPDHALRRRPWPSPRGVLGVSPVFLAIAGVTVVCGVALWTGLMPHGVGFLTILFVTAGWITSLCIHEFGHAITAYLGGDRSVAASGYLTLNPLRYTNLVYSIGLPVLFLLLGGIGLPGGAVYINHTMLRTRAWNTAVSLAGPVGTLICAAAAAAPFFLAHNTSWQAAHVNFAAALAFLGFIEIFALVLNLIPVPGLDGFGAIRPWLPFTWQITASRLGMNAIFLVFLVLWFVAPARDGFYQVVFHVTAIANINPLLIFFGQSHMRFA